MVAVPDLTKKADCFGCRRYQTLAKDIKPYQNIKVEGHQCPGYNKDLDFVKRKTKEKTLSSFRQHNKNPQQNLSKEELADLTNPKTRIS